MYANCFKRKNIESDRQLYFSNFAYILSKSLGIRCISTVLWLTTWRTIRDRSDPERSVSYSTGLKIEGAYVIDRFVVFV